MKNYLILILLLVFSAPVCSGAGIMESVLTTIVPSAAIVKTVPSSKNNSIINPENGFQSGLEAIFNVKTNGDDNTYDFILSGKLDTLGGPKNAYVMNNDKLYLMLGNKDHLPDTNAVSDISSGTPVKNPNIIAYPIINTSLYEIKSSNYKGELCCRVLSGGNQDMNISQVISNAPMNNTYSIEEDMAGVYEAVITLNIYRKP